MYGCNYTAYQINKTFNLEYKKDKKHEKWNILWNDR
jgi:hypothetical protein